MKYDHEGNPLTLEEALQNVLNSYSRENASNTPDFVLAQYLMACLEAFEHASKRREQWYGKSLSINSAPIDTEREVSV